LGLQPAARCRPALQSFGEDHSSFKIQLVASIRRDVGEVPDLVNIPKLKKNDGKKYLASYSNILDTSLE